MYMVMKYIKKLFKSAKFKLLRKFDDIIYTVCSYTHSKFNIWYQIFHFNLQTLLDIIFMFTEKL